MFIYLQVNLLQKINEACHWLLLKLLDGCVVKLFILVTQIFYHFPIKAIPLKFRNITKLFFQRIDEMM